MVTTHMQIYGKIIVPHIPTIVFWSFYTLTQHKLRDYPSTRTCQSSPIPKTNFGIDLLDIIFDTKHEPEGYEVMHHAVPNIVLITIFILLFQYYWK